jgi:hypothetical protein
LEVPPDALAARLDGELAGVAHALSERDRVVRLEGLDRAAQAAVLGRARGFVGGFGVEACLALLLGRPAVVCVGSGAPSEELGVASSFLGRPPFGPLHVLEVDGSIEEAAERAAQALTASVEALAAV